MNSNPSFKLLITKRSIIIDAHTETPTVSSGLYCLTRAMMMIDITAIAHILINVTILKL